MVKVGWAYTRFRAMEDRREALRALQFVGLWAVIHVRLGRRRASSKYLDRQVVNKLFDARYLQPSPNCIIPDVTARVGDISEGQGLEHFQSFFGADRE